MPQFSNLRSDYPLNFTLFGSTYMPSLKRAFVAVVSAAIVGKSWLISDFQVQCLLLCASHILDGDANCNGFQPRGSYTHPPARHCQPECGPICKQITFGTEIYAALPNSIG